MSQELGLYGNMVTEWNDYVLKIYQAGVFLNNHSHNMVWYGNKKNGNVNTKMEYNLIL